MRRFFQRLFHRDLDADLREEIESHVAMRTDWNARGGMTREEAELAARRQFGNATRIQEEARRMHISEFVEGGGQDLRYAARGFLRAPGFTITAILTVALGIGATTAVFSVVDRILFRSLPYPNADRLVSVGVAAPIEMNEFMLGADYIEWRRAQTPFESFTTWRGIGDCDLTERQPARLTCAQVESNFLPTLGVQPVLGRNFTRDEDLPNSPKVALLSFGIWQSRFGADPKMVGRTISLDGQPTTVLGVLPPDFEFPTLAKADLIVPEALDESRMQRPQTGPVLRSIARLKADVSIPGAEAALQPLFAESLKWVPPTFRKEVHLRIRSLRDRQVNDARLASWILMGAVVAVLLIACANVANLMLARAASRRRELSVRAALGAGRGRLVRQALTESVLLSLLGGLAGCGLAYGLLRVFIAIGPDGIPRLAQASLDTRVLCFGIAVSLLAGVLFGLAPALERPGAEALGGRRTIGSSRGWLRHSLVAGQIAASLVLLAGANLLVRSLWKLQNTPLGMRTESVVTGTVVLGVKSYSQPAQQYQFFESLERKLEHIPGVEVMAISDTVPPAGLQRSRPFAALQPVGHPKFTEGTGGMVAWRSVTPHYFAALGIPILRGRVFQEEDRDPKRTAVILSDSFARRLFPAEDPIGKGLSLYPGGPVATVVGISSDVKNGGISAPPDPEYYVARRHSPDDGVRSSTVILRTAIDPRAAADWLRSAVASLDSTLPVAVETMEQRVRHLAQRPRFNATLLGLFAGMGVVLAAVGLYGVISFLVTQRTQEIGVRMALGATRGEVTKLVLSHAARWTVAGAAVGLAASLIATRWLRTLLYEVPERDPLTLGSAAALLIGIALLAAWIPSRRAAMVDPMKALRQD